MSGGFSGGSGNLIQQTLTNASYSIENVNYAVTPVANGCTGTLNHLIIVVIHYRWFPDTLLG